MNDKLDKIIHSILIAAIVGLGSLIYNLDNSVTTLKHKVSEIDKKLDKKEFDDYTVYNERERTSALMILYKDIELRDREMNYIKEHIEKIEQMVIALAEDR